MPRGVFRAMTMMTKHRSTAGIAGILVAMALVTACTPVRRNYLDPSGPKYIGRHATTSPAFDGNLKVVSFNIKLGQNIDQAVEELESNLALKDADIVLLQEMDAAGVETISRLLSYNYVYYPAVLHSAHDKEFGNAILSRWPIRKHLKVILPHEHPIRKMRRNAVFATLDVAGREVLAGSVHTEVYVLGNEKRIEQMEAVVDHIDGSYAHVIVGGDFNTDSRYIIRETERIFLKAGFKRATRDLGPTARGDPLGIVDFEMDHIFVKGLEVVDRGKDEGCRASDHFPIWVTLRLEEDADPGGVTRQNVMATGKKAAAAPTFLPFLVDQMASLM